MASAHPSCKIVTYLKWNCLKLEAEYWSRWSSGHRQHQPHCFIQQRSQWQEEKMKHVSLVHINMAVRLIKCASYWVIWQGRHSWHTWYQRHNPAHCSPGQNVKIVCIIKCIHMLITQPSKWDPGFYQIHDIGLGSSYPTIKNSAPQQPILWSSIALHCVKKMNGSHSHSLKYL